MTLIVAVLIFVQSPEKSFEAKVVAVADGDTLTVLREKSPIKIRLYGIDAPESGQDFGTVARRHLSELVAGKAVRVEPIELDRYGRTVARVVIDGESLSLRQVRDGMAWWFRKYAPGDVSLDRAETEARTAKRGLWSMPEPVAPWDWRGGTALPPALAGKWVASSRSTVYHAPGCRSILKIAEKNRLAYGSAESAEKAGFKPAKDCP